MTEYQHNSPISEESKDLRTPPTEHLNNNQIHSSPSQGSRTEYETSPIHVDFHDFLQFPAPSALGNHQSAFRPHKQHFDEPRGVLRHPPSVESAIQVAREKTQMLADRYLQTRSPIVPSRHPESSVFRDTYATIPTPSLARKSSITSNEAAHIATVYSNMGKTKKGHLCGFCGKIYSPKYGLKIHIRQVFFYITGNLNII